MPGNATQPLSFAPNLFLKQGAKLVTGWEDVVGELLTPTRMDRVPAEAASAEQRATLILEGLRPRERTLYDLVRRDQAKHVDELMDIWDMTPSEVLAARFDWELKEVIRQLPGKQFLKVLM